jgi:hypothetical protein
MMAINRAYADASQSKLNARPGEILHVWDDGRIAIACSDGSLIAENYDLFPQLTDEQWRFYFKAGTHLR